MIQFLADTKQRLLGLAAKEDALPKKAFAPRCDDDTVSTAFSSASSLDDFLSDCDESSTTLRRAVHFDTDANEEYANHSICREDVPSLWFDPEDFRRFRHQARAQGRKFAADEQRNLALNSYERTVHRLYQLCADDSGSSDSDDDFTGMAACLVRVERRNLVRLGQASSARHGLEKYALPRLQKQRLALRAEHRRAVLSLLLSEGARDAALADRLRETSERLSRQAARFAHYMAASLESGVVPSDPFMA